MGLPRLFSAAFAVLMFITIAVPVTARADDVDATPVYVALGDSFAAGPFIPLQEQPWGCLKSTNNYAKHVAARLGYELRDATCSGARTRHMTEWQEVSPEKEWGERGNPPQFDRLDRDVDVVTLQIGGNDIGFGGIAQTCGRAGLEGRSCRGEYKTGDRDILRERIAASAPLVGQAIRGIGQRAPKAKVLVLGYSGIFRIGEPASCPAMLVNEEDAQYLRGIHEALNAMIAEQARRNRATYVDVYWPSAGHTACDAPIVRWVEPIVPAHAAAPIHPNLTGMLAVADILEATVNAHR